MKESGTEWKHQRLVNTNATQCTLVTLFVHNRDRRNGALACVFMSHIKRCLTNTPVFLYFTQFPKNLTLRNWSIYRKQKK